MLTAQDIRDVKFTKTFGGYRTDEVDAFLDQCAAALEEMDAADKENARKMQVLAETVVDYRNQEDSIRSALMNAQRMGDMVTAESKEKADALLAETQQKADALLADAQKHADDILDDASERAVTIREDAERTITAEREELRRIKKEVSGFKSRLLSIYREHLTLIGVLEDDPQDTPEKKDAAPAVQTPEEDPEPVIGFDAPEQPEHPAQAEEPSQTEADADPEPLLDIDTEELFRQEAPAESKLDISAYVLNEDE